jgi:tetratricopeptide (TPR) repeat protein
MRTLLLASLMTSVLIAQASPKLVEGVAALNDGNLEKAVALLEEAVTAEPASTLPLLHLANAQLAGGPPRDAVDMTSRGVAALKTLQHAQRVDPGDKLVMWNLAMLYGGPLQQTEACIAQLRQLIELDPTYPDALSALGSIQTLRALNAARQVRMGGNGENWIADALTRARVRSAAGAFLDDAQTVLGRARSINPNAPEPFILMNLVLRMQASIADDIASSNRLIEEADQLRRRGTALSQQRVPRTNGSTKLDPNRPPPRLPAPGPPPPPPPR